MAISIHPVRPHDVPALAQLGADAFENDRQTQMKALGKEPFDMKAHALSSLPGYLDHPRCVLIKAVDDNGDIMGYCNWGFRGWEAGSIPGKGAQTQKPKPASADEEQEPEQEQQEEEGAQKTEETDPIKKLENLTDADMERWMDDVMPDGCKCIYVVGLSVAPEHQGKGAGKALLKWGTDLCDEQGAYAWVHSSEGAWKMYEKSGFRIVRTLDVDLDLYAPAPAPDGRDWGHYVFRYMVYGTPPIDK